MGKIIKNVWESLPNHHPVELDVFQIMPNHVHFVLVICARRGIACNARNNIACNAQTTNNTGCARTMDSGCARTTPTRATTFQHVVTGSLPCVIRSFKSECSKQIRRMVNNPNMIIWQRNYYEQIIRNETDLNKIREYIQSNPLMWERDRNNI